MKKTLPSSQVQRVPPTLPGKPTACPGNADSSGFGDGPKPGSCGLGDGDGYTTSEIGPGVDEPTPEKSGGKLGPKAGD